MRNDRRDVMKALADARPDSLDPAQLIGSDRSRKDLTRILTDAALSTSEQPVVAGGGRVRQRAWLWAVPVTAVAAAAAVLAGTVFTTPTTGGGDQVIAAAPTEARVVLLNAADKLGAREQTGEYWRVRTQSRVVLLSSAGGKDFALLWTGEEERSVGVKPGAITRGGVNLNDRTEPRTEADGVIWREVGSPAEPEFKHSTAYSAKVPAVGTSPQPKFYETSLADLVYPIGGREVSYADLQALPKDPVELRKLLARSIASSEEGSVELTRWLFHQAASLITLPVPTEVRQAAYRLIADLPGVQALGEITDPNGRRGVGVGLPRGESPDYGTTEEQLIIDQATGLPLAQQEVLRQPGAERTRFGLKDGDVVRSSTTLRAEWTDEQLAVPSAG
ncbi:CU044_5270 family protein [Goodfellowiella coeruleoviolacea]|uniref:CU044_5270 family protein n=1 Tax=Goodfellowiella coeruleoviolacea TaxID=334858 RepID=A0AAE3GKX4_9PSEU|nr:CU044_5270 family protein [Goodfellowiella coeruleoviolacea]MCP2169395.1 hypothetical protein [Goodfellowiella coeruleoviolacea]